MRTFDLGWIAYEETFEGYRSTTDLLETWSLSDPGSVATLTLCDDPYSALGQRRHVALTLDNDTGSTQTVTLINGFRGMGIYVPAEANPNPGFLFGFRYRADPELDGITVGYSVNQSAFAATGSVAATCDDAWHTFTGTGNQFVESVFATGEQLIVTVPDGVAGVVRFDDFICQRTSQLARVIDSSCPVAFMRCDWADGVEEELAYLTDIYTADDGTEQRQSLRAFPRVSLRYTTIQLDNREATRTDAWLYANHGLRVAVPRWQDAIALGVDLDPGALTIFPAEAMTERWFVPYQRVLLYESPARWESVVIEQTPNALTILLDVNVNSVQQAWTAGSTLIVPLVPGRLVSELDIVRDTKRSGRISLNFTLDSSP